MFIVLEGLDGAGKSTQIAKLRKELEKRGMETEYLHFPRFDAPLYGEMISSFLRGEMGNVSQVDPYFVAMLYAGDRKDAAGMIRHWLEEGKIVVADRYVYSNIGYQCAKVAQKEDREKLKNWILDLEYGIFSIPRPDISLFLDVPFIFTKRKLESEREGEDRKYLNGKKDIHEASLDLQQSVRQVYLDASLTDNNLKVIDCGLNGEMNTPEGIFLKIMENVSRIL